ncbi:16S rRNA (cytosine(967)-C(5))-methyltransferase RsmB [Sinimarinibacterium sp. HSW-8]|uniref:16S rRNA (cytosine(967)-C(5))-methyltransferase n=1 Tax=Sinimarinibacterium thermocellulolyticum TaxID=3170016 RepID=A0ABV2A9H2_9GAMM
MGGGPGRTGSGGSGKNPDAKGPYRGQKPNGRASGRPGARPDQRPSGNARPTSSKPVAIQHKPSRVGAGSSASHERPRVPRPGGDAPLRGNHRPLANVRAVAARTISRVLRGRSLDDALEPAARLRLASDAAMVRTLSYGVLRELSALQWLTVQLLDKPLAADDDIAALLLVGIHQMRSLKTPAHAAIHETVDAVEILKQPQLHGLVNAVLRRYAREGAALEQRLPKDPAVRHSHPAWLVEMLQRDWPQHWEAVLAANNLQGPLTLRVNRRRLSRDEYVKRLAEMNIAAEAHPHAADAVTLAEPRPVEKIPGFVSGQVSVQDASAQLAVDLLDLKPGQRVLDACAAPGGKTAHILERADVNLTALDADGTRLIRVDENLRRLKLKATVLAGDAGEPARWHDRKPFDRILVDAPCSGTGVIRRHPDIKWLRRPTDVPALQQTQLKLLKALWPLLKPGGRLVYATCSLLRDEGDEIANRFRLLGEDLRVVPIDAAWGEKTEHGRRLAPGGAHDGFYYAVFEKKP